MSVERLICVAGLVLGICLCCIGAAIAIRNIASRPVGEPWSAIAFVAAGWIVGSLAQIAAAALELGGDA